MRKVSMLKNGRPPNRLDMAPQRAMQPPTMNTMGASAAPANLTTAYLGPPDTNEEAPAMHPLGLGAPPNETSRMLRPRRPQVGLGRIGRTPDLM